MRHLFFLLLATAISLIVTSHAVVATAAFDKEELSTFPYSGGARTLQNVPRGNTAKRFLRVDAQESGVSSTLLTKAAEKLKSTGVAKNLGKFAEKAKQTKIVAKMAELKKKAQFKWWYLKKMTPEKLKKQLKLDVPGAAVNTKKQDLWNQYDMFYKISQRTKAK